MNAKKVIKKAPPKKKPILSSVQHLAPRVKMKFPFPRKTPKEELSHPNNTSKLRYSVISLFWFVTGFFFAAMVLSSVLLLYFQYAYHNKVIPGVFIDNTYVGEKTKDEIEEFYNSKNQNITKNQFQLSVGESTATISAQALNIGYNSKLIAEQAAAMGKSPNLFSNLYIVVNSYLNGTYLKSSYTYDADKLKSITTPLQKNIYIEPVDALFTVENNRVVAFKESQNGQTIDFDYLQKAMLEKIPLIVRSANIHTYAINIPIKILEPSITTEKANKFGIAEVIAIGTSSYVHSIPNRIYNVTLAASRINGILVAPNEEFSFDKYLGDVSKLTGYKEAYVIQNGKTVLGDGGGVCQVSTTLFRALLNAGLPITERHAHAYRVGYYESGGSPPGLDATVFYPTVDLKFKNDTGNYILIQNTIDPENMTLTFTLYGKKDNREVALTKPVITSQTPPPPTVFQDDPTLPKGEVKQVDFEAWGANVTFNRTVKKDGKTMIQETYNSRYAPWQAVFLKGTKEG